MRRDGLYRKLIARWNRAIVPCGKRASRQRIERPLALHALYRCVEELADSQSDEKRRRKAAQSERCHR